MRARQEAAGQMVLLDLLDGLRPGDVCPGSGEAQSGVLPGQMVRCDECRALVLVVGKGLRLRKHRVR